MGRTLFRRWTDGLAGLLFPPVCVHCREVVEENSYLRNLCRACALKVHIVQGAHCRQCGHPFFGPDSDEEQICPHCLDLRPKYREGRTAVLARGPARSLVHELKYHAGLFCLPDVRTLLSRAGLGEFASGAILVPVPLHPRKLRERGFNQSLLIAECLARTAPGSAVVELLRRTSDTVSQTRYDRRTRRENLKNAFAISREVPIDFRQPVVLVDDVFTTGSTLNACAGVLRRAGFQTVDVVTLGHG